MAKKGEEEKYAMKISRTTLDQLSIKLTISVLSGGELVANSHDADAAKVMIKIPLNKWLATKVEGEVIDQDGISQPSSSTEIKSLEEHAEEND